MTDPVNPVTPPTTPPPTAARSAAGDAPTRLGGRAVLVGFAVVLGAILLLAALGAILADAPDPPPDCPPGTECGGPPEADASTVPVPTFAGSSGTAAPVPTASTPAGPAPLPAGMVGIRAGVPWASTDHGFEFEYSDWWSVDASGGSRVDLVFQGPADALLIVDSVASSDAGPEELANRWRDVVGGDVPDLRLDAGERNAILGPGIGFVDGLGRTYAGTWTSPQAATVPIGVSLVTASDGRTTVAFILLVWNPDTNVGSTWRQHAVRGTAELVLKTFRWAST